MLFHSCVRFVVVLCSCSTIGCIGKAPLPSAEDSTAADNRTAIKALPPQSLEIRETQDSVTSGNVSSLPEGAAIEPQSSNRGRRLMLDTFSNMQGFAHETRDGVRQSFGRPTPGRVLFTSLPPNQQDNGVIRMKEDTESIGPDGKPGVLSLEWERPTDKLAYSVFRYSTKRGGPNFNVSRLLNATSSDEWDGVVFQFSYKGLRATNDSPEGIRFDVRLGIEGDNDFYNRLDLGRITATSQWNRHQVTIVKSNNTSKFVASLTRHRGAKLGILFSHVDSILNYREGDRILIDDIAIYVPNETRTNAQASLASSIPSEWIDSRNASSARALYLDRFEDVAEAALGIENGAYRQEGKSVGTRGRSMFVDPESKGDYAIRFAEDPFSLGPDGTAGVLSIAWPQVAIESRYCGFMYTGRRVAPLFVEQIVSARNKEDLDGLCLQFRFRGVNDQLDDPVDFSVGVRLEADRGDQYANRLELGPLKPSETWGYYSSALSQGKNVDKFLHEMESNPPLALRIVWSQLGRADSYCSGDTLLIDDVAIVQTKQAP